MNLTLTITDVLVGSHGVQSCLSLFQATSVLAHLSIIDIIIIASYFVMVAGSVARPDTQGHSKKQAGESAAALAPARRMQ
jgi:hypothetical protein